ncbi:MAG: hypothetical protein WC676_08155 [Candidatus Omnitrophota bacterium]
MKKNIFSFGLLFAAVATLIFLGSALAQDQEEPQRLTQEEFAVELVRQMRMDQLLPTAALPSDCVELLDRIGIAPLKGWNHKAFLTREEYLVIMAKAHGREGIVHEKAVSVEEKNREVINVKWQEAQQKSGQWLSLDELLNNREYFPQGAPKSPYGVKYKDANGDHKVDPLFLPIADLIKMTEIFSSR